MQINNLFKICSKCSITLFDENKEKEKDPSLGLRLGRAILSITSLLPLIKKVLKSDYYWLGEDYVNDGGREWSYNAYEYGFKDVRDYLFKETGFN